MGFIVMEKLGRNEIWETNTLFGFRLSSVISIFIGSLICDYLV